MVHIRRLSLFFSSISKLVLVLLLPFLSCKIGSDSSGQITAGTSQGYKTLLTFVSDQVGTFKLSNVKVFFVLTEEDCYNCNRSFAYFVEKYVDNPKCFFIIINEKDAFDVSSFEGKQNTVFSDFFTVNKLGINRTCAIIINDSATKIDTIIAIEARHFDQAIHSISQKIR